MTDPLFCWKCGATLQDQPLPLSRLAACRACGADLHVCRMCLSYRPRWREWCAEDRAEPPLAADRANFCDYFRPNPQAHASRDDAAARAARTQLETLFGGDAGAAPSGAEPEGGSEQDASRRALEDLFKK